VARNNSRSKLERFVKLVVEENGSDIALFDTHSLGLYAGRDPYAYNFSKDELRKHMERLIDTFNEHLERVWAGEITKDNLEERIERDDRKIKWDSSLKDRLLRLREKQTYKEEKVYPAFYRPFVPMWVYFDGVFNSSISRLPSIFPTPDAENLAIVVSGKGSDWFDAFITDRIVDYGFMYNTQIFPLYIYTEVNTPYGKTFQKHYNITDQALNFFRSALKNKNKDNDITKEDIFFYVFGLLSTPFCVKRFRNNKELPRVPILDTFREISKLGKQLAGIQLIYQRYVWAVVMKEERVNLPECSNLTITADENAFIEYVENVKLDQENRELLINGNVKVKDIPEFALECKIGNCSPIKWVSRYLVRQEDKETGVVWNPKLRVAEFVDIVRKLIAFSWMCLKIKQKLEELYFTSDKIREEEKILNEVFNLDFHEFLDEYTDKGSGKMPDFYLWSKEEGLPDLAIEVKTLQRDEYRILEENSLDNALKKIKSAVLEHSLSIGNLHIVLRLRISFSVGVPPGPVERTWNSLKKELDKYKEKWEYILGRINEIEKILEDEDQEKYVKDLSHQKKEQLRKIIGDIEKQDEGFLKDTPRDLCLGKDIETCAERVMNVKTIIQTSKEEWIKQRIKGFVEAYFYKELGTRLSKKLDREGWKPNISEVDSGNGYTLDILFLFHYIDEGEIAFHIKKIKEYVEESIGKFDTLRKQKFEKSDHSLHLELLLVKGETVLDPSFNSLIEEIEKWLNKNGHDYLLCPIKQEAEEEIVFETKRTTDEVRILGAGEAVYYLIIHMNGEKGRSIGDDWKTQIRKILKIHEKPDYSIVNALDNPEKFAEEVDKLIEAYPSYLGRLIRDLRASLMQCTSEKALKLIKEIVKKSNKKDILLEIAKLLIDAFEKNLIPVDYKDELWEVIDEILNKLDKLEIEERIRPRDIVNDKYNFTIFDTVEGSAIASLILYPRWLKKNNKIKDLNSIPEVKGKLEYYLNKQTSMIIHAVYGFYLHSLLYTDEHWTKDMIPKIFPKDSVEHFWGAWCAYVKANRPHYEVYNLLKDIYAYAIENMKYDIESECNKNLVYHLADLYGCGIISLDDHIFHKFWEKANDDVREEFISYVGQYLLKDEKSKDVIERFKTLWEWRMSYIKGLSNRQDFQKELKSFIHWFVSRKFDTEWALDNLIKTVELVDEITEEHVYLTLDVLVEMVNDFPELVLRYLDLLTNKASKRILNLYEIRIKKSVEEISKILESRGKSDLEKELKKIKEAINLKLGREVFSD
jgi:hypothetical protein